MAYMILSIQSFEEVRPELTARPTTADGLAELRELLHCGAEGHLLLDARVLPGRSRACWDVLPWGSPWVKPWGLEISTEKTIGISWMKPWGSHG